VLPGNVGKIGLRKPQGHLRLIFRRKPSKLTEWKNKSRFVQIVLKELKSLTLSEATPI